MNPRWIRIQQLFNEVADLDPRDRAQVLQARCPDDESLRAEVLSLLAADDEAGGFLETPVSTLPERVDDGDHDRLVGQRFGPYRVERRVGHGGMGSVYLATRVDDEYHTHVALKVVRPGMDSGEILARFRRERQTLARLMHPNIARLLDGGTEAGVPYFVMDFVDGAPIDEYARKQNLPLRQRLELFRTVCGAVHYAHQNLVVHRDLKPANILVTKDGTPKLVDFGIARVLESSISSGQTAPTIGGRLMTPEYASPEQIRGEPVTTATDVYSLGVVLYELIAGETPHAAAASTPYELERAIVERDPERPSVVAERRTTTGRGRWRAAHRRDRAATNAELDTLVLRAIQKQPERRYASAEQLGEDVRRYLHGLPLIARPDRLSYRARKFVGRHRLGVAAAGLLVIAMAAGIAGTLWQARVAMRQARVANEQRARAEQVSELIAGVLGATPTGPDWALRLKGASLRVVEMADMVAERIDKELSNQPEAEATVRYVIATTYTQTGQISKAQHHGGRAVELHRRLYAPDDPRRLSAELLEATISSALGRFSESEAVVLDVEKRWKNPPPSARAAIGDLLGVARFRLGRLDHAEQTFLRAIDTAEQAVGANHPSIAQLCSDLSTVYLERGQYARAAAELERAVAIARANYKEASAPLGWALVNLANTYRFLGQTDAVLRNATGSYEQMRTALGESHYSLIHPLALIAYAKALRGEPDAESIIRRGVSLQAQLPADHYERAVGLTFLGFVLMHERELPESRRSLEEALRIRRKTFASPNWRIAETAGFLGQVLALQGENDRAAALLRESVAIFTALYGSSNPRTIDARERLERMRDAARTRPASSRLPDR